VSAAEAKLRVWCVMAGLFKEACLTKLLFLINTTSTTTSVASDGR
jgi:hypothetical protein